MSINEIDQLKSFYSDYEKAIAKANYKQVGEQYTEHGAILTTYNGTKILSLGALKSFYARIPIPECDFHFDDLQIELLSDNAALVNAIIHCQFKGQADVSKIMYTAVLLKSPHGWKIRHEHESPVFETFKNMLKRIETDIAI